MSEPITDRELAATVDRLLLEQGRVDPFELLIALDLLAYADYDAWRMGARGEIQTALALPAAEVVELLERAGGYARGQGLEAIALGHQGWGGLDQALTIGAHPGLARELTRGFEPPAERHQLDLFQDSGALLAEEETRCALAERRLDAARDAFGRLLQLAPPGRDLSGFLRLIQAAEALGTPAAGARPAQRLAELESAESLARRLLGRHARDFMSPLWSVFAESLAGRPFEPREPRLHAAAAWARADRWPSVRESVEAAPNWRDHAALVLLHSEACRRTRDPAAALADWMWLCWEHPDAAERALAAGAQGDRRLAAHWGAFADLDPELPVEDFPAWLLLQDPGLAILVPSDRAPADERGTAYRLLHRLIGGDDQIEIRRALSDANPDLFRLYLSTRR